MDTFAHFWRSEELHNEIAIVYTRNEPEKLERRERIEAFRREKRWKIEIAFSLTFSLAPPCAVEWIFPQALFSVWVLVFMIQVAFDGSRAEVEPCRQGTESQFQ